MVSEIDRTLSYRRAQFAKPPKGKKTLEHFVMEAYDKLPSIADRTVQVSDGYTLEGRHQRRVPKQGHFIHLVAYTAGEEASIVPEKKHAEQADIDTAPPPEGSDYMDGDMMALISADHVIICSSSLHEARLHTYLTNLFEKAKLPDESRVFSLMRTADVSVLKTLQKEGIKEISFESSIYEATIDHVKRKSTAKKIEGALWDEIKAAFSKDKNLKDVLNEENISAEVIISFDARKKGDIGPRRLDFLGKKLVEEGDSEFEIITREGNTIRGDQMSLKKRVRLPKYGKTVAHGAAFDELGQYFLELKATGFTEQ